MGWRDYKDHRISLDTQNDQGKSFDPAQRTSEIQNLLEEIRRQDPHGGCWDWVMTNLADSWRLLMGELRRIDTAFQEQSSGELTQAIASTRTLYQECVKAWGRLIKTEVK